MTDQSSIFNEQNTSTQTTTTTTSQQTSGAPNNQDTIATLLSAIKNERGEPKYANVEAALEGLRNAQEFIPNLRTQLTEREQEIERLRVQAERAAELERTIEALTSQQSQTQQTTAPELDENKLAEIVNQTLTKRELEQRALNNVQTVVATLQQTYGTEAEKKFYDKASELGMTMQEMNNLAAKSPKAVLTMLGVQSTTATKPNTQAPTTSTVNSAAFTPNQGTFIGRNPTPILVGATTSDINQSMERAKKMVEELHSQGKEVHDLTNPKVYFKFFNQ